MFLQFFLAYAYMFLYNFVRMLFANERAYESAYVSWKDLAIGPHKTTTRTNLKKEKEEMSRE